MTIGIEIVLCYSALLWSIVLHELGHLAYFRWVLNKRVNITFGEYGGDSFRLYVGRPSDYRDYSTTHRLGIYISGMVTGLLPLILLGLYYWLYSVLIIWYLIVGCGPDIKAIMRLYK